MIMSNQVEQLIVLKNLLHTKQKIIVVSGADISVNTGYEFLPLKLL
jgi:hypothetical protein